MTNRTAVTRYDKTIFGRIVEDEYGQFIRYNDFKKLCIKNDDLQTELTKIQSEFTQMVIENLKLEEANMAENKIMKFFEFKHLPEYLRVISSPIGKMAVEVDNIIPDNTEKAAGMRKLLEAKDCFARAKL